MPDQFSKTISSDAIEPIRTTRIVKPAVPVEGKIIGRKEDVTEERHGGGHHPWSRMAPPDPDMWDMLLEALQRFNRHQDFENLPYAIRLWAQNDGFRIQLIHEETGDMIKQTKLIPFSKVTADDLDHIINSLIGEEGIVIDLMR